MPRRAFTVDEANALLPDLERVMDGMEGLRSRLQRATDQLHVLDALWGRRVLLPENPDHEEFLERRSVAKALVEELERMVETEILARGIRFPRGGLEHGLVDFPTTLDGRWVYLCWRRGEPEVGWWHEVDGGFAGRRELTRHEALRMGRDDREQLDESALDF